MSGQRPVVSMLGTSKEIGAKRFRPRPRGQRTKSLRADWREGAGGPRNGRADRLRKVDASGTRDI